MGTQAFIAYSIPQSDAHMVYELGELLERQGYTVVYNYKHPDHPKGQHMYDEVSLSGIYVGLITSQIHWQEVIQLFQYAKSQHIPAVILKEDKINLPGNFSRDPDIITYRRFMPENPIQRIELWVSHQFR